MTIKHQSEPPAPVPMDRQAEALAVLYEISRTLAGGWEMVPMIARVLALLDRRLALGHGMLVLFDPQTDELAIEVAHGFTREELARGRYRIGEGITGAVFKDGKPLLIPDLSREPRFLNRTIRRDFSKEIISMLAVPVKFDEETIGVLSVDREAAKQTEMEEDLQFLVVIAALIGQVVRVRNVVARPLPVHGTDAAANFSGVIGSSPAMRQLFEMIRQVAPSKATLLLRGESGTGKELLAHTIHAASPRSGKSFIAVHCASLPATLLESELFGHERGAFTGAVAQRRGRFELADGGTLFLDEVGDIPLPIQTKLLRVIQEKAFERVGGQKTIQTDVRIIAATHRPLEEMVRSGAFREDLYYRLNVVPIVVPPLREHREDIPLLAAHFLARFGREHGKPVQLSSAAMTMLSDYRWPGNVRELEHCLERLVLLTARPVITPDEIQALAHFLDLPKASAAHPASADPASLPQSVEELEKTQLAAALERSGWVKVRAARRLGITPRQLDYRMKKYQLERPEDRE